MKKNIFWGIHASPTEKQKRLLGIIPFILLLVCYGWLSNSRTEANPKEKITPTYSKILDAGSEYTFDKKETVFNPFKDQKKYRKEVKQAREACVSDLLSTALVDKKELRKIKKEFKETCKNTIYTESKLWQDIKSSLFRLIIGVMLAAFVGFFIGLNMGLYKGIAATFSPLITFFSIIPPLALLPIFMITMGTGEVVKIMIIFFGLVFLITRDMFETTKNYPKEMFTKALTLGATQLELTYKIIAPQILPNLINSIRLNLGGAWLFLIASEAMSATAGLGYNIFLVKRYMSMDVILFYVVVITIVGFMLDRLLLLLNKKLFPWFEGSKGAK